MLRDECSSSNSSSSISDDGSGSSNSSSSSSRGVVSAYASVGVANAEEHRHDVEHVLRRALLTTTTTTKRIDWLDFTRERARIHALRQLPNRTLGDVY